MDNSLDFTPVDLMKLQGILEKLNKIYVANLKWQHQRIISSSPHRFSEKNLHICDTFERILIFIYGKISQVYFYEIPRYCDNQVQFVILLNM
jgi:hypothetical protein